MPALETALYEYLTDDPGVSALVGDRVYPGRIPEGTNAQPLPLPAISFKRVSAQRIDTYDAFGVGSAWATARVQFSCWAASALESIEVGEAVLLALSGYAGQTSGLYIGASSAVFESDQYDAPVRLHQRIVDFFISYEDPVPAS